MISPLSKKIGRIAFLVRCVLVVALTFAAILFLVPETDTSHTTEYWESLGTVFGIGICLAWIGYAVIPRCRDIGLPWWCSFGMLLPILNLLFVLVLLVKKAEPEEGRSRPPENNARDVT